MALSHASYQNSSPIKRIASPEGPPWGVCPACGRTLGSFDRVFWEQRGWRRGECLGCEKCFVPRPGEDVLAYAVWEEPQVWELED